MNHISRRFLSLILAVVFLLSAAGVSFGALFRGVEAHAADSGYVTMQRVSFYQEVNGKINSSPVSPTDGRILLDDGGIYHIVVNVQDERFKIEQLWDQNNKPQMGSFDANLDETGAFRHFGSSKVSFDNLIGNATGITYDVIFERVKYTYKYSPDVLLFSVKGLKRPYEIVEAGKFYCYNPPYRYPYNDNNNDDDSSSSSNVDIDPPTPTIIVSKYDYGGVGVTAASDFTLRIRFTNTSKKLPVDNIVMKVTMPEAFTMTNSSNTFYVEKLSKQASLERELSITVKPSAEPISQVIKIAFTYEAVIDDKRKQLTAEQEISVPVSQLDRFSFTPIEAPPEMYVGDSNSIEAKFVNKGKSTVFNVTAEILGNITQPGQRQFIGNIESGKEETADFLVEAKEAGEVQGEVVITYEDANMHVTTLRQPFNAMARAMDIQPPSEDAMGEGAGESPKPATWYGKIPIWTWVAGGVGFLVVVTFISKLVRHYREKKLLEDDDEDF